MASLTVSGVSVVVWVLDDAQVVVFRVGAVGFVIVVGGDVATKRWGSEHERRGWGLGWDMVGWPGSECRRFRGAGRGGSGWNSSCEVVVDVVDNDDGGCAGVDGGDMAGLAQEGGVVPRAAGLFSV
jgi:hypothetical protein